MTCKEVKYGLGNLSFGNYQPIYDSEDFCRCIFKHFRKECWLRHIIQIHKLKLSSPFDYLKGGGYYRMVFSQSQLIIYQVQINILLNFTFN